MILPGLDLLRLRRLAPVGVRPLTVLSLLLLLLFGGGLGWLFVNAESTDAERARAVPRVVLALPPPLPIGEPMPEPVPGIDVAMPLAPANEGASEAEPSAGVEGGAAPPTAGEGVSATNERGAGSTAGEGEARAPERTEEKGESPPGSTAGRSAPGTEVALAPAAPPAPVLRSEPGEPAAPEVRLPSVPDPALVEPSPEGPLPTIGADGREPWRVYARPFVAQDDRPRIAVVVSSLGLSSAATEAAIQQLPGGVTLAFAPYAENLDQWIRFARAAGHEILLDLPMEPMSYPQNDPGPYTLLTTLGPAQNLERMRTVLSRVAGYVGVTNYMGSRFTASETALRPVLQEVKNRGLLFLDTRSSSRSVVVKIAEEVGVPHAANDRYIDNVASRAAIDARLSEIERIARRDGVAVAVGFPYPVTIERLARWTGTLEEKGFALAPVSAVVARPGAR